MTVATTNVRDDLLARIREKRQQVEIFRLLNGPNLLDAPASRDGLHSELIGQVIPAP